MVSRLARRRAQSTCGLVVILWGLLLACGVAAEPRTPRAAVERALPALQRSAATFVAERGCVSCHHNVLPVLLLHQARDRGFGIDAKTLETIETKTFRELRSPSALDAAVQGLNVADPTPNDSFLLMAAHAAGLPSDLTTGVYAHRIARWQRDGHWTTSDFRPPHSSSPFTATASAVRAIRWYLPEELAGERDRLSRTAKEWLLAARPHSTEDAAFRLLGLVWAGASAIERDAARRDLLALQKPAGGWPQLPGYPADAYSTGEALVALSEAGTPVTSAASQGGFAFLLSSQARDGTWHVRSRMISPASVSPEYFATGFPYGKDEFLSYAGSCWAVMALMTAMPPSRTAPEPAAWPRPAEGAEPSWARTALFGSAADLRALLASGLDPNSATAGGTTLLMMAAPNPEKIALLIERGANPKARTGEGVDAITAAASYRDTAPALERLLEAGAEAQPPDGVRVRRSPLVFAAMAGDLANVKLLLSHGAEPSAESLSEAVTFGHADIVRVLIRAGADARIAESSGVNLLHWAAITNRAAVIPVLVEAGVPLNDTDGAGFTPLMYAATLDLGDTAVLRALIDAGADRRVRNAAGRTALAQARFLGHREQEGVLRHRVSSPKSMTPGVVR